MDVPLLNILVIIGPLACGSALAVTALVVLRGRLGDPARREAGWARGAIATLIALGVGGALTVVWWAWPLTLFVLNVVALPLARECARRARRAGIVARARTWTALAASFCWLLFIAMIWYDSSVLDTPWPAPVWALPSALALVLGAASLALASAPLPDAPTDQANSTSTKG